MSTIKTRVAEIQYSSITSTNTEYPSPVWHHDILLIFFLIQLVLRIIICSFKTMYLMLLLWTYVLTMTIKESWNTYGVWFIYIYT